MVLQMQATPIEPIEPIEPMTLETLNESECWQAVLARDSSAPFVYAVQSTGIYCRPSCPSRRPRRERVQFFATPAQAEQAGFRACQRCRPQQADPAAPPPEQVALVQAICRALEAHVDEQGAAGRAPRLADLAARFHLSPAHMQRTFKRIMGVSPRQYAAAYRLEQFKTRLRSGEDATVTETLYEAGYSSSSRVYEDVSARMGMTPAAYRQGGKQQGNAVHIRYTIVDSPLSRLLLATTEQGLCAVTMGNSDEQLAAGLQQEYPAAHLEQDDAGLQPWAAALLRHLAGQQPHLDLPLDVQATAFQWQVWQALREIPYGETRSYSEVAEMIGRPTAARAVAQACASNQVAIVIPCHRVVRGDGEMGGYRWGVERKQALLRGEQGE